MVHHNNQSEGRRKRRKRSKKSSSSSSDVGGGGYSASCEELSSSGSGVKVQVREQDASALATFHSPATSKKVDSHLPEGLKESLRQLLQSEMAYHPRTDYLLNNAICEDKVDADLRDEAMFNLRFLHKFYNLAPECFAHAVNITDRFLARVKVKPKYMSCLATAAYLIAAKMIEEPENWPSPEKLVRIARCGGSPSDLERMAAIIRVKLRPASTNDFGDAVGEAEGEGEDRSDNERKRQPAAGRLENAVTPLHFLSLLAPLFSSRVEFQRAIGDLETCLCSVAVYSCRPALLALCVARQRLLNADCDSGVCDSIDLVAEQMRLNSSDLAICNDIITTELLRYCSSSSSSSSNGGGGGTSRRRRRYQHLQPMLMFSTDNCARLGTARHLLRRQLQQFQHQQPWQQQQHQQQHLGSVGAAVHGCALGTICE